MLAMYSHNEIAAERKTDTNNLIYALPLTFVTAFVSALGKGRGTVNDATFF